MTGASSQSRVVLHVGVPKSGTTFLQRSLSAHAEALADRGVLYPQTDRDTMFLAALDVRGNHKAWGRKRKDVEGSWDELCARARAHRGTAVISHELLAAAGRSQIDAATSMLRGLDVHLVVTVRDLARQLVAEWQEGVKHGRRLPFADFYARVQGDPDGGGELARHFHRAQDLPDVLGRWGQWLPADHVHVVVGAPEGSPASLLWRQFARVVGFDPTGFPPVRAGAVNRSLGRNEIDLLRRVNTTLDGRLRQPDYGRLAKHRLAQELLACRPGPRPRLPRELYDDLVPVGEGWAKEIDQAGYVVHGDLDDLVPKLPAVTDAHPDAVEPHEQVACAADVIAELLLELRETRDEAERAQAKRTSWKKRAKEVSRRLAATSG